MTENVKKFNDDRTVGQMLVNLAERWLDEKEYEDIREYQKVIQTKADAFGITLTGMTKRPFGCTFSDGGYNFTMQVKLRGNRASVQLSWVKA